jgi:LysW-gamma-L-lysine carboxypeptidase
MDSGTVPRGPVDETTALGLLRGMLEVPSPSYQEEGIADYLATTLPLLGFGTHIDRVGNLVAELDRGPGPTVMLLGHMDTVPGDVPVRSAEGRLYGRGAVDAKGPLATMICAAAGTRRFRGRIVVVGAVEEETPGSRGAMEIRGSHARPDAVVIGEPSGWSSVVLGYKGKLDLRYHVDCPPTHPSSPVPKASEVAAEAWPLLLAELGPDAGHGRFDVPGATLVSIRGDIAAAQADFSVRTPIGFDSAALVSRLRDRLQPGRLTVENDVAACRADRGNPMVRSLTAGIRAQHGVPSMKVKSATSDMNTLSEVWDVPMATYGPGDSRLDHADDEHVVIADYFRAIAVLTFALEEYTDSWHDDPRARRLKVLRD